MAVATQFQNSMLGHQYTHQKGHPSGIFVTRIIHSTNQAQISLHYECSRKPIPLVLQRDSIKGDLILGSLGGKEELMAPYLI